MVTPFIAEPVEMRWHSGLPILASEAFLQTVADEYGWLGGFTGKGALRCILPYTIIKKPAFRIVRFRTETFLMDDNVTVEEEKSFLNSVVEYFRKMGADIIVPAANSTVFRTFPDGAVAAPYGSYIINLNQSIDTLWGAVHAKHRNVIRSAMKKGVRVRYYAECDRAVFDLVRDTLKRSNLHFMKYERFHDLCRALQGNIKIVAVEYDGVLQGCAVVPFSQYAAYYLYGGSILHHVTGAMNLLHWNLIEHFRELGVKRYDFVGARIKPERGSKQEGLALFKQRFGGRLNEGFMWKFAINPVKYSLYSIGMWVLSGGDVVDQEASKMALQGTS